MLGPAILSMGQNLQPENAKSAYLNADDADDISVPILSNRYRLLVVPQKLKSSPFRKTYRTRGSRRSLGHLKGFMDLPMDVAFETAMYLAPKDLLQLSRLSKHFRSIFASRSALFVWQTVFRNVDLECFEDLNEIQFASLLYDKCCMACGRITRGCQVFFLLRLRLCLCCQTANFVNKGELWNQYPAAGSLIHSLPEAPGFGCFEPEAHLLIQKFLSLRPENTYNFITNVTEHTIARREASTSIVLANARAQRGVQRGVQRGARTKQSCWGYGAIR